MNHYKWSNSYTGFGYSLTKTVKVLIIINVSVFILIHLTPRFPWLLIFGMVPRYVFNRLMLWQLVTYMFMHASLMHLAINMLMLWFFGPAIENAWGKRQFLFYYLFTGIGASLCSFIIASKSSIPVVGASGAIFGILVAYAMMFPETIILLFFIFPMKIKHAVFVLVGINLLGALSSPGSGIAYFAHLGGGLFGYLYLKSEWIRIHLSNLNLAYIRARWSKSKVHKKRSDQKDLDRQVDFILDKISRHGMESLTKEERKVLERKSRQ